MLWRDGECHGVSTGPQWRNRGLICNVRRVFGVNLPATVSTFLPRPISICQHDTGQLEKITQNPAAHPANHTANHLEACRVIYKATSKSLTLNRALVCPTSVCKDPTCSTTQQTPKVPSHTWRWPLLPCALREWHWMASWHFEGNRYTLTGEISEMLAEQKHCHRVSK